MGDPPHRAAAVRSHPGPGLRSGRAREDGMRVRAGGPAPRPARRRRRITPGMRRAVRWTVAVMLAAGAYGGVVLSRQPIGETILAGAAERALAASAALGLVVGDIEVEGRETTDSATIMAALSAQRGTPILAVSPRRAKEQLESLPWVRSAVIERRL